MPKVALITGVTGQDGAYLAELLLQKGYIVHGLRRRSSSFNSGRIEHLYSDLHESSTRFFLHYGDLTDATNLIRLMQQIEPDELYNLGAQSHVYVSFETPEYTANADGLGTMRLLETIRILGFQKKTRFYQASTSEMYGKVVEVPQSETTPFYPRSPYAVAKLYAYWITVNYREAYGIHASNGILFNHEGPTRGETFVTRKITRAVAAINAGTQKKLYLGNLDAKRDWGHARDYVEGMWKMMQMPEPDDYVLATGETHSVREFVELAFAETGRTIVWKGSGEERNRHGQGDGRGDRRGRSALLPSDRGRPSAGRRDQGAREARLAAEDQVRRIGPRDGSERHEAARRAAGSMMVLESPVCHEGRCAASVDIGSHRAGWRLSRKISDRARLRGTRNVACAMPRTPAILSGSGSTGRCRFTESIPAIVRQIADALGADCARPRSTICPVSPRSACPMPSRWTRS